MTRSDSRLDKLLVERGLVPARERAQALILAGKVLVDGVPARKAGQPVSETSTVELIGPDIPFVSRGGLKLEHALKTFGLSVQGLVAIDVGASTGGFTDCMLQNGAAKVYAVDVGYGQFAWSLRQDPRVVLFERQNIRHLAAEMIPDPVQFVAVDTSFISLKIVLPATLRFAHARATIVALIKPQFEAGRARVGKGGVVRDPEVHREVCESIVHLFNCLGLTVLGLTPSPILGPKGNREFLIAGILGNFLAGPGAARCS